jgi:ATP-dependent Clp protease ATP-binding subunit ClpA
MFLMVQGWRKWWCCLLLFCAQAWVVQPLHAALEDYYNDTNMDVRTKFVQALAELKVLFDKAIDGNTDSLSEQEVQKIAEHLSRLKQYKFEFVATGLKEQLSELRRKFPDLYFAKTNKTGANPKVFFKRYIQVMTEYLTAIAELSVEGDINFLEVEATEIDDQRRYFKKRQAFTDDESYKLYSSLINKATLSVTRAKVKIGKARANPKLQRPIDVVLSDGERFQEVASNGTHSPGRTAKLGEFSPAQMDIFRAALEAVAINQPEAEQALVRMEAARETGLLDEKPQKVWFVGPGGVGKTTYANAFANALSMGKKGGASEHTFRMPVCQNEGDLSTITGSSTGYIGSDEIPPFIKFLVKHSGGKYHIETIEGDNGKEKDVVVEGPDPRAKGKGFSPHEAVVVIEKLDQWSSEQIRKVLVDFISEGRITLRAPTKHGASEIVLPVRIIINSRHASELIFPDKREGQEMTYAQAKANYESARDDKARIRASIRRAGTVRFDQPDEKQRKVPEDLLDMFSDDEIILLQPHDEDTLQELVRRKIAAKLRRFGRVREILGNAEFEVTQEAYAFLASHNREISAGGNGLDGVVDSFFENPILDAITSGELKGDVADRSFVVDFVEDERGNIQMRLQVRNPDKKGGFVAELEKTLHIKTVPVPSDIFSPEEREKYLAFERNFDSEIYGMSDVGRQLSRAVYLSEAVRRRTASGKARRFMALGLSATGKTQAAKVLNKFLYGENAVLEKIDFNNVSCKQDVIDLIFGKKNQGPSPFMQAYDRNNGNFVMLLDEIANVSDMNFLVPLYQLLDEAEVNGFNDGHPRKMGNVTFNLTGNASEEIYNVIMRDIPEEVQRQAQLDIYNRFNNDPQFKRATLERHFRQAFLNRFPAENIVIHPPLSHVALRELVHSKLGILVKGLDQNLKPRKSNIVFESAENYAQLAESIEWAAFDIWVQGRSIESFVNETLDGELLIGIRELGVSEGEPVHLRFVEQKVTALDDDAQRRDLVLEIEQGGRTKQITVAGKKFVKQPIDIKVARLITAVHEAGHEIARRAFSAGRTQTTRVSILPGIAEIAGHYVYYAGIAKWEEITKKCGTRAEMLAEMATLIAGGEAGRMAVEAQLSESGQSNDLERANAIAEILLLKWGLDSDWGFQGPGREETIHQYLERLSDSQKEKLEKAKRKLIEKATGMAKEALEANKTVLFSFGLEVARVGDLDRPMVEKFFESRPVVDFWDQLEPATLTKFGSTLLSWLGKLRPETRTRYRVPILNPEFVPNLERAEVASIDALLEQRKSAEIAHIQNPASIKYRDADSSRAVASVSELSCRARLHEASN